jgi:biotin-(acetyl-CoA carboxylase) ligase
LERLAVWLDGLAGDGMAAVIAAWLGFAQPAGTELTVRSAQHEMHGRFAGLGPAGELLLAVEDRIETFSTGEILMAG